MNAGTDAKLLLDVTRLIWRRWVGRRPTGIDRVCLAYLEHFGADAQAVVQYRRYRQVLTNKASAELVALLKEGSGSFRQELIKRVVRFGVRNREDCSGRLYLNIGHTGLNSFDFRQWVKSAGLRPVYLVHDLIPITHPHFCRAGESERHRRRMQTVLSTAAGVIGNSQATLDSLARFGRDEELPSPPTIASWLGTQPPPGGVSAEYSTASPTFVVLGTIEGRKNHLMLLLLWERLIEKFGSDAPRLLVIGQRGWECEQVLGMLDRSPTLRKAVTEIGGCSDQELAVHLANARALLFPSLVEGFGLPLVEALSNGTPVIASDIAVFREIGQSVPDLIEPLDAPAWERAILSYASEPSAARDAQLRRLAGYRAPTWSEHFTKVGRWLATL